MVTGHAVERRVLAGRRVLSPVTVDAPAHRERRRRGSRAHEVQEVDRQARTRLGREGRHGLDRAMARLALVPRAHMRLVLEVGELRQLVHADPWNRLLLRIVLGELLYLWQGRARERQ